MDKRELSQIKLFLMERYKYGDFFLFEYVQKKFSNLHFLLEPWNLIIFATLPPFNAAPYAISHANWLWSSNTDLSLI